MRIKSYKLFLESLNNDLYKDEDYILHGLFTPFYDKYYEIHLEKGWIGDNNEFRIMTPGKNKRLGYSVSLYKTREFYTKEDIQDSIDNIEFDDMKLISQTENNIYESLTFIIDALKVSDITIDHIVNELGFITKEQYLVGDAFIKEQLENSTLKRISLLYKRWYNQDNKWIMQQDLKYDTFDLQYDRIWNFFEFKFGLRYEQIQQFIKILLESNLNCRVFECAYS